jgi:hypothetical protein
MSLSQLNMQAIDNTNNLNLGAVTALAKNCEVQIPLRPDLCSSFSYLVGEASVQENPAMPDFR